MAKVLVTGGSGFIGAHIILQLVRAGHQVRTTVRSLKREGDVRSMLKAGGAEPRSVKPGDGLWFFAADLGSDAGWTEAVSGCDYVLHVASPIPLTAPKHEDDLIIPAREGTLRVLRVSRDAGVKRVVLTSTCGAVYYGHALRSAPFDETSWTIVNDDLTAYVKSKAIAERAAWDFIASEGGGLELSAVNPAGVFGPVLGADYAPSVVLIKRLMDGMPGCPRLYFGVVDVRDVADLHIRAMTHPSAKGERFIAVSGDSISMLDIARMLRTRLGAPAKRVPRLQLPDWLVRLAAKRNPEMEQLLPLLGKVRNATSEKARRVLGWSPRSNEEAVVATAQSLLEFGLLNHQDGRVSVSH
jgi:nucleoside-diphosphate-sugar epimerase